MPEFINCLNSLSNSHASIEMDSADLSQSSMETETFASFNLFHDQPPESHLLPLADKFPSVLPVKFSKPAADSEAGKKRKLALAEMETGSLERDQEKAKRGKKGSMEGEKAKEVVHVRARRGQATDSHSLAERVRRERINEKMRCLQDLVPGCYKTMGMATMLDEIINYVQSLQNQVEFLSMKLFAASSIYDFNLEVESMAVAEQVRNVDREALALEVLEREVGYGCLTTLNSTLHF